MVVMHPLHSSSIPSSLSYNYLTVQQELDELSISVLSLYEILSKGGTPSSSSPTIQALSTRLTSLQPHLADVISTSRFLFTKAIFVSLEAKTRALSARPSYTVEPIIVSPLAPAKTSALHKQNFRTADYPHLAYMRAQLDANPSAAPHRPPLATAEKPSNSKAPLELAPILVSHSIPSPSPVHAFTSTTSSLHLRMSSLHSSTPNNRPIDRPSIHVQAHPPVDVTTDDRVDPLARKNLPHASRPTPMASISSSSHVKDARLFLRAKRQLRLPKSRPLIGSTAVAPSPSGSLPSNLRPTPGSIFTCDTDMRNRILPKFPTHITGPSDNPQITLSPVTIHRLKSIRHCILGLFIKEDKDDHGISSSKRLRIRFDALMNELQTLSSSQPDLAQQIKVDILQAITKCLGATSFKEFLIQFEDPSTPPEKYQQLYRHLLRAINQHLPSDDI